MRKTPASIIVSMVILSVATANPDWHPILVLNANKPFVVELQILKTLLMRIDQLM